MKKFFKNWNLFELIFLACSLIIIAVCFIVGADKNVLSFIASLVGVLAVLFAAKGLVIAPYINIVYNVLYAIVSITQRYYGEAIIYIGLMIPINIASIVVWFKNRSKENKDVVEINKIRGKEYIYISIVTVAATVGFYFLLAALNTNQLIISTISLVSSMAAAYFTLRRSKYYALAFILNDVILIVMWGLIVASEGIALLPTVISFCVFLVNDVYGFVHWVIEERKQNKANRVKEKDDMEKNTEVEIGVLKKECLGQVRDMVKIVVDHLEKKEWLIAFSDESIDGICDNDNLLMYGAMKEDQLLSVSGLFFDATDYVDVAQMCGIDESKAAEIGECMTLPQERGKGYMFRINKELCQKAKELGYEYVIATAHPDNRASCGMLEKLGLKCMGQIMRYGKFLRNCYMMKL